MRRRLPFAALLPSLPSLPSLLVALALAPATGLAAPEGIYVPPGEAISKLPVPQLDACAKPGYALQELINQDQGLVVVAIKVGADGSSLDSAILASSGSRAIDEAARASYLKCKHTVGLIDGKPATMWAFVHYFWYINNTDNLKRRLAQEALAGKPGARYQLGALLKMNATYEEMWRSGMELIIDAAHEGDAMAQVMLGAEYESGANVDRDMDTALLWYRKAAAQGNVFAADHLRVLELPAGVGLLADSAR